VLVCGQTTSELPFHQLAVVVSQLPDAVPVLAVPASQVKFCAETAEAQRRRAIIVKTRIEPKINLTLRSHSTNGMSCVKQYCLFFMWIFLFFCFWVNALYGFLIIERKGINHDARATVTPSDPSQH